MVEMLQTFFQEHFPPQLAVFLIAMVPLVECRGAIPFGMVALKMPIWEVLPLAIAGNILPVPFILLLIRPVIAWFKQTRLFRPLAEWLEAKADKKKDKVLKYSEWGLFAFVAIPIPGTGAWTGALIAALLEMRVKNAFLTILAGMICAAFIMTAGSALVDGLLSGQWAPEWQAVGDFFGGIWNYIHAVLSDHSVTAA